MSQNFSLADPLPGLKTDAGQAAGQGVVAMPVIG